MALAWRGARLVQFTFGHPSALAAATSLAEQLGQTPPMSDDVPVWIDELMERLQAYAAGREESFADVQLEFDHLSAFQGRVVKNCRRIGRGRVKTYGELAAAAGSPGAARAVGNVMATNRFPIIVPCHRVVGSAGSLGGFSARDGIRMKRRMLEMEGALPHQPEAQARVLRPAQRTRSAVRPKTPARSTIAG
jgi:methylated-DNA-[protein]-cysteine S-methyltransferase